MVFEHHTSRGIYTEWALRALHAIFETRQLASAALILRLPINAGWMTTYLIPGKSQDKITLTKHRVQTLAMLYTSWLQPLSLL